MSQRVHEIPGVVLYPPLYHQSIPIPQSLINGFVFHHKDVRQRPCIKAELNEEDEKPTGSETVQLSEHNTKVLRSYTCTCTSLHRSPTGSGVESEINTHLRDSLI